MVAARRARVGSEGPAAAARPPRSRGCVRTPHRLGHGDVDSRESSWRADSAGCRGRGHCAGQRPRLRGDLRERRPAVRRRPGAGAGALDAGHAAQSLESARARKTGECLRRRRIHRRDRRGPWCGSAGVPHEPPERSARPRRAVARRRRVPLDGTAFTQSTAKPGRSLDGPGDGLPALQAGRKLRRGVQRTHRRSGNRTDRGATPRLCPRLRAGRQPRGVAKSGRGRPTPGAQPDLARRSAVGSIPGHERRLVELSNPHVHRSANGRRDSDQPAEQALWGLARRPRFPSLPRSATLCSTPPASASAACRSHRRG